MARTTMGANRKTSHFNRRRVSFVLADSNHKLMLVSAWMMIRLKKAEFDRNIYEGPIVGTWRNLPINLRKLDFVGVLMADTSREYQYRLNWIEESDRDADEPGLQGKELLQSLAEDMKKDDQVGFA